MRMDVLGTGAAFETELYLVFGKKADLFWVEFGLMSELVSVRVPEQDNHINIVTWQAIRLPIASSQV